MTYNPPKLDTATALMLAADYVEQGQFDFFQTKACFCQDRGGCPGAWLAYVLGLEDADAAFNWIGLNDVFDFADVMKAAARSGEWMNDRTVAAAGLRQLAQEHME